ncbi:ATPase [Candidatus Bathyarchaeota archaeon]|nr:MAG: ATPase [Candidatus Bathyarchaeota archaeon]
MVEKILPDSSIIINGKMSSLVETGEIKGDVEIVIPLIVVEELQSQASKGRETGFLGLKELKKLRVLCEEKGIPIKIVGERPSLDDIRLARSGRIDALILDLAKKEDCILYTSDYVQALTAEADGTKVKYLPAEGKLEKLVFEKFFTPDTLSIHLKEGVPPLAKKGVPEKFELKPIQDKPLTAQEIEDIVNEIFDSIRGGKGFYEISRSGAMVIQLEDYRIAIARPPFSDGIEVTIVRPVVKLRLEDYKLSDKLMNRLREKAEGILIAGPPGSGKTTFASSLAEFYMAQGKIVKTLESPRDLQVGPEITQYGPLEGSFEKAAEILLLVRPDYTIFDELRKTEDFNVFADMRLAGVGMVGVVHASNPIDAIQRFIGRIELGMIPHIVDTLIFIRYGKIERVYDLTLTVKVPTGMTEEDLARPVIEIRDFETGNLEYEIYTFGNENVVVPVSEFKEKPKPLEKLAEEKILDEIRRFDPNAEVELKDNYAIVKVSRKAIPRLVGKGGLTISRLEKKLGIRLEVQPIQPKKVGEGEEVEFTIQETRNTINLNFNEELTGKTVSIHADGEFLFPATVSKKAQIRISKRSKAGKQLLKALNQGKTIRVTI